MMARQLLVLLVVVLLAMERLQIPLVEIILVEITLVEITLVERRVAVRTKGASANFSYKLILHKLLTLYPVVFPLRSFAYILTSVIY